MNSSNHNAKSRMWQKINFLNGVQLIWISECSFSYTGYQNKYCILLPDLVKQQETRIYEKKKIFYEYGYASVA